MSGISENYRLMGLTGDPDYIDDERTTGVTLEDDPDYDDDGYDDDDQDQDDDEGQDHDAHEDGPDDGLSAALAAIGPTEDGKPRLLHEGRYALYVTPEGGLHLAYLPDGQTEEVHMPIPAAIVRMSQAAATGAGPLGRLKAMVGR